MLIEDIEFFKKINNNNPIKLSKFFEKIKFLSELEKASTNVKQFEKDIAFIESLKPLLSKKLQVKADEAIKMIPFFSIVPILKKNEKSN